MEKLSLKELADRVVVMMAGRNHKVFVDWEAEDVTVFGINVPMLNDLKQLVEETGAWMKVDSLFDAVILEV